MAVPSAGLCSELSARLGLPLIGSAGHYDRILAFELESPWTPRLVGSRASSSALNTVIARISAEAPMVRLLALRPRGDAGGVRVLEFFRTSGAFLAYARREHCVAIDDLAATLEQCAFAASVPTDLAADVGRDLLVCTHGTRDACCGKFGYPIFREFERLVAEGSKQDVRVWGCSHLGGHRFAPTVLDLPSGRMFGRLNADDAALVLTGGAALAARVGDIYRGRCALPEAAQIVERDLWRKVGAPFEDAPLEWHTEAEGQSVRVVLRAGTSTQGNLSASPRDQEAAWSMEALVDRTEVDALRTPASCGGDPKPESPWRILS